MFVTTVSRKRKWILPNHIKLVPISITDQCSQPTLHFTPAPSVLTEGSRQGEPVEGCAAAGEGATQITQTRVQARSAVKGTTVAGRALQTPVMQP